MVNKNKTEIAFLLTVVLCILCFASTVIGKEIPIDSSSPIIKAVLKSQKAIEERDPKARWGLLDSLIKGRSFGNNFDNFDEKISKLHSKPSPEKIKLKKLYLMTPNRAWVEATNPARPQLRGFYLVKEGGKWKISSLPVYLQKVREDLKHLEEAIGNYFESKGKLPERLSQLVPEYIESLPLDPFNDSKDDHYAYTSGENVFEISSFGPDSDDDQGTAVYNREAGAVSDGDILVRRKKLLSESD